jgi:hypothetical protein
MNIRQKPSLRSTLAKMIGELLEVVAISQMRRGMTFPSSNMECCGATEMVVWLTEDRRTPGGLEGRGSWNERSRIMR